jgi:hypothetical protein
VKSVQESYLNNFTFVLIFCEQLYFAQNSCLLLKKEITDRLSMTIKLNNMSLNQPIRHDDSIQIDLENPILPVSGQNKAWRSLRADIRSANILPVQLL